MTKFGADFEQAIQDGTVRPAIFYEGEFASGTVRLWSGHQEIVWDGRTWSAAGLLIGVSPIEETEDIVASGVAITLSGVPLDLQSLAIQEAQQGAPGRVWLALMTEDGEIIADPYLAVEGRLDVPEVSEGDGSCTVAVSYESRLIDLNRTREWRYTHESQQALFPGDKGFEFVSTIQDKEITWGRG